MGPIILDYDSTRRGKHATTCSQTCRDVSEGPALRRDSGRATPLPHPPTTRCCGGTPCDAVGSRVRLRAVDPGRVAPLPHPLTVWCRGDFL